MLAIVGPCSIHDAQAALEYAKRLQKLAKRVADQLFVVMRTYFEKPRTAAGWKGLIYDPYLNGSNALDEGMRVARSLLLDICSRDIPCTLEWVETFTPQFIGDLISWSAIGARTCESQTHRQLASGVSSPVGFKNSTSGDVVVAIEGLLASRHPHVFMGIDADGHAAVVHTIGNPDTHLILRGGKKGPNYDHDAVAFAQQQLNRAGAAPHLLIDCSHGNSGKDHTKQPGILRDVVDQRVKGNHGIIGFLLESNLVEGKQALNNGEDLNYGQSITDSCLGWDDTEALLLEVADKLRQAP